MYYRIDGLYRDDCLVWRWVINGSMIEQYNTSIHANVWCDHDQATLLCLSKGDKQGMKCGPTGIERTFLLIYTVKFALVSHG